MAFFYQFVVILSQILTFCIFIRIIMSWFPGVSHNNPFVALLYQVTEPILAPIRKIVPRVGLLDFTPFVAVLILQIIAYIAGSFA